MPHFRTKAFLACFRLQFQSDPPFAGEQLLHQRGLFLAEGGQLGFVSALDVSHCVDSFVDRSLFVEWRQGQRYP